jgi:hypothetical protein
MALSAHAANLRTAKAVVSKGNTRMVFKGNGCCRFNGWRGINKGYISEAACKSTCLASGNCAAADMARPRGGNIHCFHFVGDAAHSSFKEQCGTNDPTQKCFRKEKADAPATPVPADPPTDEVEGETTTAAPATTPAQTSADIAYQDDGVTAAERDAAMKKEAAIAAADKKDDTAARAVAKQAAARTDEDMQAQGAAFSANKKDDEALKVEDAAAVTGQVALDAMKARNAARAASDAKDDAADAKRVRYERGPGGRGWARHD